MEQEYQIRSKNTEDEMREGDTMQVEEIQEGPRRSLQEGSKKAQQEAQKKPT